MTIYAGAINRDHVHMLIGIPPHLSVSRAVQYLKGKSSHKLLSDEVWKKYIEDQKPEVPDDNFKVV